ncbi:glycosyltransferase [Microbacterium lacus]|uniref:glycosyltransferase n=1 Tax=Microbacterium lacus TaxID=415217 RepID=UPI00385007EE
MTDLVVVSLERWDEVWRRNQHLVAGLLEADPALRVLFVEPPDDPLHGLRSGSRPQFGHRARPHSTIERLHVFRPVKWLPRRVDRAVDDRFARGVRRAARKLGMLDPLVWINDPAAAAVARQSGRKTLYDITDDWAVADRPAVERERIVAGERALLATAAAVTACSAEIIRRKAAQRGDITLIHNAVSVRQYVTAAARPTDLPSGPIALYVGTVHPDRVDIGLCIDTARALDGRGTVVLVGPNLLDKPTTRRLIAAGVVALGARPREAIPGYLQHADVLLVPHVVTPFTDSLDPIKLYEYQAVGRPVVSTPVAGFRDAAAPVTVAARVDFASAVNAAIPATHRFPQDADAGSADWSQRIAQMQNILTRLA